MKAYVKGGLLVASLLLALSSVSAVAGEEQLDSCDHGASGKVCRLDPQPDHGQDCDYHGAFKWLSDVWLQVGGTNEDHCRRPQD